MSESWNHLVDTPLRNLGFEFDEISADKVSGRLLITPDCCQPFHVLHGGVSALIAEGIASLGACIANGGNQIAGMQLTINHLKPARSGDYIVAEAKPISSGKSIQVWDVHITKQNKENENETLIASSRVTIFCFHQDGAKEKLRQQSKL